jgi:hypothetical protein
MRKTLLFAAFLFLFSGLSNAQTKTYVSAAMEMIFSFAQTEYTVVDPIEGDRVYDKGNIMRWAPVLNMQAMFNVDVAKPIGFFTGAAIRNVGYIYDVPESSIKKKYRTYNFGIPIGIKIGNVDKFFVYGGYEVEFPFHYKEKTFTNNSNKQVYTNWFTDRVETVQQSVLVGINFPYGVNLKFKYYLTNFHNQDFYGYDPTDGSQGYPYANMKANVFYFSLCFGLFEPVKKHYNPETWDEMYR